MSDLVYMADWRSAARAASVFSVGDERGSPADDARSPVSKVTLYDAGGDVRLRLLHSRLN